MSVLVSQIHQIKDNTDKLNCSYFENILIDDTQNTQNTSNFVVETFWMS